MWQELRDYWLPLMLYLTTLVVASVLLIVIISMPFLTDLLPFSNRLIELFANDMTVRRTCLAGSAGLFVTAFLFFRPNSSVLSRNSSSKKPPPDSMAGA